MKVKLKVYYARSFEPYIEIKETMRNAQYRADRIIEKGFNHNNIRHTPEEIDEIKFEEIWWE